MFEAKLMIKRNIARFRPSDYAAAVFDFRYERHLDWPPEP
jgi:hypothetical protein